MKRYLSFILACTAAFTPVYSYSLAADNIAEGICGENISWIIDGSGTLTISGKGDMPDWRSPDYILWADFKNSISSVVVGEGITSIGSCSFAYCEALTEVSLPSTITEIHHESFRGCSLLEMVKLPENLTFVGDYAFSECENLPQIDFPDTLCEIGSYAFSQCRNLAETDIPKSVSFIGTSAFEATPWLDGQRAVSPLVSVNNLLLDGTLCENEVIVPTEITAICGGAFANCTDMTSVIIPNSVDTIGEYAFSGCDSLETVEFPNSLRNIGIGAFELTPWLEAEKAKIPSIAADFVNFCICILDIKLRWYYLNIHIANDKNDDSEC